ncbi:nif11-like leader peptide domain protein [Synechococcus sp. RS9909]|uniref:Nif11-like leader peptide family natural product precursor n=1 Tax=unclassified Synechococcus TaxID=2626047 RepID=UPI0000690EA6|nr:MULTISPECIES: Nif11-like leader peptide family natural product precursor [unclassified Synechococcus]EAQ68935.1 hypothetical protein RS9917_01207 [Synechococcus sp. RS9917]QNI78924.1 nif11-like leader peptide domain protein [Synechococcus sp. RS9909]
MALADLDRLLELRGQDPELAQTMAEPLAMDQLIALAAARGLAVTEADVLAAQERADAAMAPQQLQERVAQEARRLRHFIQG